MALTPEQELAKAKEEYETAKAQAKARYEKARARHATAARKLDTRRKIVAGGALFDLAGRDMEAARVLARILDGVKREQDRKAFEGWEPPSPASAPAASSGEPEAPAPSASTAIAESDAPGGATGSTGTGWR